MFWGHSEEEEEKVRVALGKSKVKGSILGCWHEIFIFWMKSCHSQLSLGAWSDVQESGPPHPLTEAGGRYVPS